MEVVASLSQGRTAAAQCGLFTYKSVPVIFEPPCIISWKVQMATWFDDTVIKIVSLQKWLESTSSLRTFLIIYCC